MADRDPADLRAAIARAGDVTAARVRASVPGGAFVRPGESSTGGTRPRPAPHRERAGRIDLRAPDDAERAALVEALELLVAGSVTGVMCLTALRGQGAVLAVVPDRPFEEAGGGPGDGSTLDATADAILVRGSWLAKNPAVTASTIAHAAVLLVDMASGLVPGAREQRANALARVSAKSDAPADRIEELVRQTTWELSVATATRALLVQGQVLRELGMADRSDGPLRMAAAGANDRQTYDRVFAAVVAAGGALNPDGRRCSEPVAL